MSMKININNTTTFRSSSVFNTMKMSKPADSPVKTNPQTKNSSGPSSKKVVAYTGAALGVLGAVIILLNRKKIGQFFSNLFKKTPKPNIEPVAEKPIKPQNSSAFRDIQITEADFKDKSTIVKKVQAITNEASKTEDSMLEGLDWFEQNGQLVKDFNFSPYENLHMSFMDEVTSAVEVFAEFKPVTDKILNKYADVYSKFAIPHNRQSNIIQTVKGNGDPANLAKLFYNYSGQMSKDTAFKFLDEIERTSVSYKHLHDFKLGADDLKISAEDKDVFVQRVNTLEETLRKLYLDAKKNKNK